MTRWSAGPASRTYGSKNGAGPGMSPSTRGMARNDEPIHSGSVTTTAGDGAGTPAAATAFWTSACGPRSYSGNVGSSGGNRTTMPERAAPTSTRMVSLACPPCACESSTSRGLSPPAPPPATVTYEVGMGRDPARQAFLQCCIVARRPGGHSGKVDHGPPPTRHLRPAQRSAGPHGPGHHVGLGHVDRGLHQQAPAGMVLPHDPSVGHERRRPRPVAPPPCLPSGA